MATTIKDIAKEAGIGTSTVSAYLNGVTVRPKNKTAIEAAIKKLGYIRNDYARALKTNCSKTIGIVIPELSNTFGTTIITSLEEALSKEGYGILVSDYAAAKKSERETVDFLMSKKVDGLVIVMPNSSDGAFLDSAINHNIPVVVIDRPLNRNDIIQVVINNTEISRLATQSILDKGHKNIGIITGDKSIFTAAERHKGYKQALNKVGLYNPLYTYDGRLSVEGGYLAMKTLAEEHPEITGLFVTNYEMSIGAIIAINELSIKLGIDFSFVGFDNIGLSRVVTSPMATVEQPMSEMGTVAAEQLLKSIKNCGTIGQTIMLSATFMDETISDSIVKN